MRTPTQIEKTIVTSGIPDIFKIFFFGINGKDEARILHKNIGRVGRISSHHEDSKPAILDYNTIEKKLLQWIDTGCNLAGDFSMDELTYTLNIPKPTLRKYFEIYLQKDFRSWKSMMRIEKAKDMLTDESVSIEYISRAVGFNDKSNFHRQFKASTGMTPKKYRIFLKNGGSENESRES